MIKFAPVIFGSILKSLESVMAKRDDFSPEQTQSLISLLQQAIKSLINYVGDLIAVAIRFTLLQLIYEDQHKQQIFENLHAKGYQLKPDYFIKPINSALLRII